MKNLSILLLLCSSLLICFTEGSPSFSECRKSFQGITPCISQIISHIRVEKPINETCCTAILDSAKCPSRLQLAPWFSNVQKHCKNNLDDTSPLPSPPDVPTVSPVPSPSDDAPLLTSFLPHPQPQVPTISPHPPHPLVTSSLEDVPTTLSVPPPNSSPSPPKEDKETCLSLVHNARATCFKDIISGRVITKDCCSAISKLDDVCFGKITHEFDSDFYPLWLSEHCSHLP